MNKNLKVALVHDYLREFGGAERVLETLHEIFPKAPVFTAYFNPKAMGSHGNDFKNWDIRTSWLQNLPLANKFISPLRIFAPAVFESFDLSEYDLVISSTAIYFAKAVIVKPEALHLSYIHTPPRYLYGYTTSFNYKKHWWTKVGGEIANHILRIFDFETSQRPDILIANSKNVAARIKKFYRRDSTIIYPPVSLTVIPSVARNLKTKKGDYFLSVGRLVRGKGIEVIIKACSQLNLPLKVASSGPLLSELKQMAGKSVQFLGDVKEEDLPKLYGGAKATVVASEDEDFGIVPVESMAAGTPVIAVKAGGFLETVIEGKTGCFYSPATVEELKKALKNFKPEKYKASDCRKQAEKFSKDRFKKEILELVEKNLPVR